MNEDAINWDSIPDIITKDQLYQICHISKSTALYLLRSGKIPCEYTGKKTRCYKIKKATEISKVIGYGTTSINDWCRKGHLKAFKRNNMNHIPKVYLIEFFCSKYFRTITRKSDWHIRVLQEFPRWQVIRGLKTKE